MTGPVRPVVCGVGAVGSRAARQLLSSPDAEVVVSDRDGRRAETVAESLGPRAAARAWGEGILEDADALVVATAPGDELDIVEQALRARVPVVAVTDGTREVRALLDLDERARRAGVPIVIGAGMAPGLSDVLARQAARGLDVVEEVHVAKVGTGGPACAHQHHRALGEEALDWREGEWVHRPGGSGRELSWFPDPIGGRDCYRAGLPDALLLVPAFPGVRRVTARIAATRRDRLTAALPMLRPPHPEGEVGAVRVEIRGQGPGGRVAAILGAIDRPAVAAGAVAALSAIWAASGRLRTARAAGLAELLGDPGAFLSELARRGVKAAAFEGAHPL